MRTIKLSDLVFDYSLYPRREIDSQNVTYMREARRSGIEFPPVVIDKKSKRVIDGFHRCAMYKREEGPEFPVEVVEKTYADEAAMFADAMRYNAAHGRRLSVYDRTHCLLRAEELKLTVDQVASALHMTVEAIGVLRAERVGVLRVDGKRGEIALKRTIRHMAGRTLTRGQADANDKLSGMNASFYVNQLIALLSNDLIELDDEELLEKLRQLGELIDKTCGTTT